MISWTRSKHLPFALLTITLRADDHDERKHGQRHDSPIFGYPDPQKGSAILIDNDAYAIDKDPQKIQLAHHKEFIIEETDSKEALISKLKKATHLINRKAEEYKYMMSGFITV